jgi:hypothetical protein
MNKHNSSRRTFLKQFSLGTLLAIPAALTFGRIFSAQAQAPKPAAKLAMVDPKDPQAQALGYHEDASKVDTKKWPKRAGAEGAKQHCANCQFYIVDKGVDPATVPIAPCQILMNKGVKAKAWCNTWTKRA